MSSERKVLRLVLLLCFLIPTVIACSSNTTTDSTQGGPPINDPNDPNPPLPVPSSLTGIPLPEFCLDNIAPARPAEWPGSPASGFFYIDNTSAVSTDSSNTYGYPDKPRSTIPANFEAGSYVEIHGVHDSSATLTITSAGAAALPVWIRGDPADRPFMRRPLSLRGTYAVVENLYFDRNSRGISIASNGTAATDHICVRNNEFSGPGTANANNSVVVISGAAAFPTTNAVIYNNTIHDYGDRLSSAENDYHGILPAAYAQYVWVLNNHVYNMAGDSIQVGQANYTAAERPQYIYIGGNHFHDNRENAVDVKASSDVIISRNVMHGFAAGSSSSGEVVVIHNDPVSVWVLFNDVYDGGFGIITSGSASTYFIGNAVHGIHHPAGDAWDGTSLYAAGAALHFRGATDGGAIHNTLYDYDIGLEIPQGGPYDIRNNIFAGRAESGGMDARVGVNAADFDYNLLYGAAGAVRIGWNSATAMDLSQLQALSQCAHCPAPADPLFQNLAGNDFRIPAASPAANRGAADGAYDAFFNRYGIAIDKDLAGNARIAGAAVDIGAYESDAL